MHRDFLDVLLQALRDREDVEAIWVDGSVGRGSADIHSDVDLGIAVDDERVDHFLEVLPAAGQHWSWA